MLYRKPAFSVVLAVITNSALEKPFIQLKNVQIFSRYNPKPKHLLLFFLHGLLQVISLAQFVLISLNQIQYKKLPSRQNPGVYASTVLKIIKK